MLRALVIALFAANLAWWAWHTPLLNLGGGDNPEREPQRLTRQVNPEQIKVLPAQAREPEPAPAALPPSAPASSASAAEPAIAMCLEAGPLDEAGFTVAKRELQDASVQADGWVDMRRERPASHAVYMGRFPDEEQLQRKREELQRINVPFESYTASAPAGLAPGFTLGRYLTNEQAQARLKELQAKGVRTARVVLLTPASTEHTVRVDQAGPAQQAALAKAAPASAPTRWHACSSAP
jgi:hypothetical protein